MSILTWKIFMSIFISWYMDMWGLTMDDIYLEYWLVLLLLQWPQIVWFLQNWNITLVWSRPFNLLSTSSKNNLGVSLNFEKAHLKLQRPIIKCQKKTNEEREWREEVGCPRQQQPMEKNKKKTHTRIHMGAVWFSGAKVWADQKKSFRPWN